MLESISSRLKRQDQPPPSHFHTSTLPTCTTASKQSLGDWLLDFSVLSLTDEA